MTNKNDCFFIQTDRLDLITNALFIFIRPKVRCVFVCLFMWETVNHVNAIRRNIRMTNRIKQFFKWLRPFNDSVWYLHTLSQSLIWFELR